MKKTIRNVTFGFSVAIFAACSTTGGEAPTLSQDITADGLTRIDNSRADKVYVNEEADMGAYIKIFLDDVQVSFVADWRRDHNRDRRSLGHHASQKDADNIKERIAELFHDVFSGELTDRGYVVLSEIDPNGRNLDVMIVNASIVDLDVTAPDLQTAGRQRTYVASAGSMSLELVLKDSMSGDTLARAYDHQEDPEFGTMEIANVVTNRSDAMRIMRRWAVMLADALGDAQGK